MDPTGQRYSSEEVSNIVRRALDGVGGRDDVSYDELEEIAREQGVSSDRLETALRQHERAGEIETARRAYIQSTRAHFIEHLTTYFLVIGFLFIINFTTSPGYLWAFWPMLGWGLGLAFHARDTFLQSEERIDKGAKKLMRKQDKKRRRIEEAYDEL